MTPEERALGARLRAVRAAAGLSQDEVAARLRIVRSVVSAAENGRRKVSGLELKHMARLYGVSVGSLLDEDDAGPDELALAVARLDAAGRALVLRYANYVAAHPKEEQ